MAVVIFPDSATRAEHLKNRHSNTQAHTCDFAFPIIHTKCLKEGFFICFSQRILILSSLHTDYTPQSAYTTEQTLSSNGVTHKSRRTNSPAGEQQHELTVTIMWKPPSQMCVSWADSYADVRAARNVVSEKSKRGWCLLVVMAYHRYRGKSDSWMSLVTIVITWWWGTVCGMGCQFLSNCGTWSCTSLWSLSIVYTVPLQWRF